MLQGGHCIKAMSMMNAAPNRVVQLDAGWREIREKALTVLEHMIEDGVKENSSLFNPAQYINTYTMCYNMCTQREPNSWSSQLYERHGQSLRTYLESVALEAIQEQPDEPPESILREYVKRWNNHKIMNKWYQRFFMYLDRYHVVYHGLPNLLESGLQIFKEEVYDKTKVCFLFELMW